MRSWHLVSELPGRSCRLLAIANILEFVFSIFAPLLLGSISDEALLLPSRKLKIKTQIHNHTGSYWLGTFQSGLSCALHTVTCHPHTVRRGSETTRLTSVSVPRGHRPKSISADVHYDFTQTITDVLLLPLPSFVNFHRCSWIKLVPETGPSGTRFTVATDIRKSKVCKQTAGRLYC